MFGLVFDFCAWKLFVLSRQLIKTYRHDKVGIKESPNYSSSLVSSSLFLSFPKLYKRFANLAGSYSCLKCSVLPINPKPERALNPRF